ncbi:MAG: hypothetical protein V3T72_17730, partial [Thermoanaerobaculia bacterium]
MQAPKKLDPRNSGSMQQVIRGSPSTSQSEQTWFSVHPEAKPDEGHPAAEPVGTHWPPLFAKLVRASKTKPIKITLNVKILGTLVLFSSIFQPP